MELFKRKVIASDQSDDSNQSALESKVESSDNLLSSNGSPRPIPVRRRQSVSCGAPQDVDENGEPVISFGEPLHVSVSRGTERFRSIQRSYSKPLSLGDEEEGAGMTGPGGELATGMPGGRFDLTTWLTGRQQKLGPPFAKRIGLVFDDLNVYGDNVGDRHIATVITPIYKIFKTAARGFGIKQLFNKTDKTRLLLKNMSGVVADGEMLLVLGRPGSGCSTLLRVLGNRRHTYRRIDGKVSYGGLEPEEVEKHYRGEVAYNQEDDVHFPTLTVRKTLQFAVQCKTPSKRMLQDREGYQKEFLDTLLDMYGLTRCADTIVGNAFMRGVSGGERKRVSIAEQVASGASIDIWDGSTKGLDSSSALDYVRSLRITTDVLHKSTVVTLYQASENIYELFDKVSVIDEGRQLYYGPADRAVAYFESIGIEKPARQTTSDFLTGVTQPHERRVLPGWEGKVPTTAEEFERVWNQSQEYHNVKQQVTAFELQMEQDGRSNEIPHQAAQARVGDFLGSKAIIIFKLVFNMSFAVIVGTLYLNLPDTSGGAFTRGGLLFFALLFNSLSAQAEIPKAITGREVVYKHKSFAMYHPAALSLAQTVVDIPFMVVQIILFSIILYFSTGLERTAAQFFVFLLYLFVGCLCLTSFFRMIGNISPNVDIAHTLSGISLLFMILLIGYMQPPGSMHPWFKWIYWINPLAYGFKALMCNEFRNLRLRCSGTSLVPSGSAFTSISNQVCTLQGAKPGEEYVLGRDYLAAGYEFYISDQWINFVAVLCFWLLFVICIALVMEYVEFGNTGYSINVYKRRRPKANVVTADNVDSGDSKEANLFADIPESGPTDDQILSGTTFTWKDIDYTVPVKGGDLQLLNHVSGYIKPGTMTALMGSSGAGKTTLLDSLSQRKTIGKLEGEMLMNGAPQPKSFRRITGYCEQLDVHNPHATVREALRFSAILRQPDTVPESEKMDYVERVIYLLGMADISDCLIGDPDSGEGISLEERKRLTIGIELVSKPKILFLDEPTSGLDAQASFKIVQFMRKLVANGQTILCTIHQPSAILFEQFDRLLLLVRGGHTVYFGNLGEDAQTLVQYFEKNVDWPQVWESSNEKRVIMSEIDRINELQSSNGNNQGSADDDKVYARSHLFQIKAVTQRMFVTFWRNTEYNLTRLALQIMCAMIVGFTFYKLNDGAIDLQNKVFAIFECSVLSILIINQVQPEFLRQRQYYSRETSTNQYGWRAFAFAIIFTEWPFSFVANTLFFVSFYWTVGLNSITDRIGYFYIAYIILGMFSLTLGQAIASFAPNDIVAAMLNPIFTAMIMLFCGVTIPYAAMPKFWRAWMYWLSPYMYYIEGVITNDLHGSVVKCRANEFYIFEPPSGQTCLEYAGDWIKTASGYINNPESTSSCQYCSFKVGDEFYESLSWSFTHRWRNIGILLGFIVFNVAFTVLMIRIYKVNKR
ncbi:ABC-2 type transporter-domain-containing protein [Kickxella alabastrina]|uniref:ABC-2 type transporter-domain-containing protein n=1 Tax=Kickxella alabastrina TaxID=61397 RepID=UPI00221FBA0B|nr:ABC-2 type transporter-domain-containing protein [Kickxella alabastrina]KAI7822125.1 ABC-2 type transporter-domain-containing protein [Kickxella alabastrina]